MALVMCNLNFVNDMCLNWVSYVCTRLICRWWQCLHRVYLIQLSSGLYMFVFIGCVIHASRFVKFGYDRLVDISTCDMH